MPISARLGIAIPTKGYIANCGFGCMFPVPLWECDDLMLACVITLHYAERSWESKIFSQGLSCSGRAKPRHPQGKNWGHMCTKHVNYSLDSAESVDLVSIFIIRAQILKEPNRHVDSYMSLVESQQPLGATLRQLQSSKGAYKLLCDYFVAITNSQF